MLIRLAVSAAVRVNFLRGVPCADVFSRHERVDLTPRPQRREDQKTLRMLIRSAASAAWR